MIEEIEKNQIFIMNFGNNKSSFFLVLIIILSSIYILEKNLNITLNF